ncbi:replicase domain protein [Acinetobacter baumannii 1419130]|nr:replicase domain protein [Acinetobacter baumannii 1419130]
MHTKAKKLTDKQIQFFANKLAHYDPFASQKAAVGESYDDLEKRLLIELQDAELVRKYAGVLKELGLEV